MLSNNIFSFLAVLLTIFAHSCESISYKKSSIFLFKSGNSLSEVTFNASKRLDTTICGLFIDLYTLGLIKVNKKSDEIRSYLKENNIHKVFSTKDKSGKLAITKYKLLNKSKSFSLLDIEILTGRKNQIRVHLSDIGNPIIGDKKYNSKYNPIKRLGLHANKLVLKHPITNEIMTFEIDTPKEFTNMFKKVA